MDLSGLGFILSRPCGVCLRTAFDCRLILFHCCRVLGSARICIWRRVRLLRFRRLIAAFAGLLSADKDFRPLVAVAPQAALLGSCLRHSRLGRFVFRHLCSTIRLLRCAIWLLWRTIRLLCRTIGCCAALFACFAVLAGCCAELFGCFVAPLEGCAARLAICQR